MDVRRRRWLFVGPYSFIHSALLLLASVAILFTLTPWIFTKCAVALQFVYVWVYLVFVLSWICPSGREEDMPAMPYTYFWSTSHGGVRITTHCARCALCNEIETMPHSDKKEEGSEAMRTWTKKHSYNDFAKSSCLRLSHPLHAILVTFPLSSECNFFAQKELIFPLRITWSMVLNLYAPDP